MKKEEECLAALNYKTNNDILLLMYSIDSMIQSTFVFIFLIIIIDPIRIRYTI